MTSPSRPPTGRSTRRPAPCSSTTSSSAPRRRSWEAANRQNQDIIALAGPLPGRCGGVDPAERADPRPRLGPDPGRAQGPLGRAGREPPQPQVGEHVLDIPAGPPVPGPDPCDRSVARFHRLLEEKHPRPGRALLGNLRAFPPRGTPDEVWNHGIGGYTARYRGIPGRDVCTVQVDVEIEANSGSSLNGQDEHPRVVRYSTRSPTTATGGSTSRGDASDWISVGGEAFYAPLNLMEVEGTRWAGHNPYVTEPNVRAIDLANGGDPARYAGAPPSSSRPPRPIPLAWAGLRPGGCGGQLATTRLAIPPVRPAVTGAVSPGPALGWKRDRGQG